MKTKDILEALSKGAVLCKGYEGYETVYWLEPRRTIVRRDVAEQLVQMLVASNDGLIEGASQTWRAGGATQGKRVGRKK